MSIKNETKAEIKLIWQTAINLGFQFNETDAHEMWIEIRDFKKKNRETIK